MAVIDREIGELYRIKNTPPQDLAEQVYETIKEKIIFHELKPGDRIIARDLAEELEVDKELVDRAFSTLEKERLIVSGVQKGVNVRKIIKEDVKEVYNIRKVLEGYVTRCAVPRVPKENIQEVKQLFNEVTEDLEQGSVKQMFRADAKLHQMLVDNCGNKRLKGLMGRYNDYYLFYKVVDLSRIKRAEKAYFDHYELFQAIKAREVEKAVKLMREHIENAKNIILDNFNEYTYR